MSKDYDEWAVTADLARLELDEDEIKILAQEAERMRQLFMTMAQANVEGLQPTTHALAPCNQLRQDTAEPFDNVQLFIDAAPETEDDFFIIPNVL